ncbi:MAG: tetratricopeptide repeat protein [Chloroflexi bacterium]|nr:tetratricopeptide repeat protein [Chloroflexota bacterium]
MRALFGDAASDLGRLTASTTSAVRADRQRLFAAIAELLRRGAAESPVLLALDDLHAADEASLQLLHYLARTTRHCSILLLGTLRPEEAPPASLLGQVIGTLRREQLAVRLDLQRLNLPESELLVATLLEGGPVDRAVFEMIHRVAAGNPFYTEELLRTLRESGRLAQVDGRWRLLGEDLPLPRHILELLSGRLERLGSDAAQVLNVAAVVGSETSYPLLRAATGLPLGTLLDALDACLASRVLTETSDGYRFGHPLQRAALYERLSLARRMSLHGSVAAALEELHGDGLEHQAEALAHHWALSEAPGRAVMHLLRAGDRAADVHANEVALTAYRGALDLLGAPGAPERRAAVAAELWEKVGDLRALAGDAPQDEESYRAAIAAIAPELEVGSDRLARLHRKAAYAALARHDVDAAAPHLSAAESALESSTESIEWRRVRLVRALWLWAQGCHAEGRAAAEESLALARQHGEGLDLINAYMTLALVFHSSGEWKEGLQLEIQHIGAAADADPRLGLLFDAHACLGEYHLYGDTSFEALEAYARHTLEIAERVGARRAQAVAWLLFGESLLLRGCWGEAAPCLMQSLELQRSVGSTAGQAFALQRLAELCVYRGDPAAADVHLQQALGLAIDPPMAPLRSDLCHRRSERPGARRRGCGPRTRALRRLSRRQRARGSRRHRPDDRRVIAI